MRVKGNELTPELQREAKSRYIFRLTKDNPQGLRIQPEAKAIFESDEEWLAHTFFFINQSGHFDARIRYCESGWPRN